MKSIIKYELPIFSSTLEDDPIIEFDEIDMKIILTGGDEQGKLKKITLKFHSVICFKRTSARFTPKLFDSYDRIVELVDSEWLKELRGINEEGFNYWSPRHYIIYLEGVGMFQFIAKKYEVIEHE